MLNIENRNSPSYIIGILLPALTVMLVILYEIIFNSFNKYTTIITNNLLLFMYFNIGIREIIIKKSKFGYFFLFILAAILVLIYRHNS